ncbi:MAG: PilZ domain-containing protein [Myxococcaceae bacterium]|nr:PilZ domain-containing protein [Myxococcaceae bacterium]
MSGSVRFFEWNEAHQAAVGEISASGVFLKTDDALPEGTHVTLRLAIPGMEKAVTVLGKVVRTVKGSFLIPAGMGVRFLDLAPSVRQAISLYVARRTVGYT